MTEQMTTTEALAQLDNLHRALLHVHVNINHAREVYRTMQAITSKAGTR